MLNPNSKSGHSPERRGCHALTLYKSCTRGPEQAHRHAQKLSEELQLLLSLDLLPCADWQAHRYRLALPVETLAPASAVARTTAGGPPLNDQGHCWQPCGGLDAGQGLEGGAAFGESHWGEGTLPVRCTARAGHLQMLLHHRVACVPSHHAGKAIINRAGACNLPEPSPSRAACSSPNCIAFLHPPGAYE